MSEQQPQQPQQGRVEVRRRTSETVAWVLFGVLFVVFVILLAEHYLHLPMWLLVLAVLVAAVLLWWFLRQRPEKDMYDAWGLCVRKEWRFSKTILPRRPKRLECFPWGRFYIFFCWNTTDDDISVSVLYNRDTEGVDGRVIKHFDDVADKLEKSKIMSDVARDSLRAKARARLLESAGFDPSEVGSDGEE